MQLRPYQLEALGGVIDSFRDHRAALVVMPTGTGKTVLFAEVIRTYLGNSPRRAMVIAHREELIGQAERKILDVTGLSTDREMASYVADLDGIFRSKVVVSSVQTLNSGTRIEKFDPEGFDLLIVDEAHHATAKTYRRVIDHFRKNASCRVLGVTATPDRADEKALGMIFETVAYEYPLASAIHDGWLVPIQMRMMHVEGLDFSAIQTTAGDLNQKQLGDTMAAEKTIHRLVAPSVEALGDRKAIVFTVTVEQAAQMAEVWNRYRTDAAEWVCGKTPKDERRMILDRFRRGKTQVLINVGVLTEGFDDPTIDVVIMGRPTKSRALYAQMLGRGTRPLDGIAHGLGLVEDADERRSMIASSRKPVVEIVEFAGNAGRHKLVYAADILGGDYDDEVVEHAKEIAAASGGARSVDDLLVEAKISWEEIKLRREREAHRRRHITASARWSSTVVDPFDVLGVQHGQSRGWGKASEPTERQIAALQRFKVPIPEGLSKRQAGRLLDELIGRANEGKATYKQTAILRKYGYGPDVSFDEARRIIDAIAANGWKRPA